MWCTRHRAAVGLLVRFSKYLCGSSFSDVTSSLLEAEIIGQMKVPAVHQATIWRTAGRTVYELADQAVLDAEDDIRVQVFVAGDEHMGHQLLKSGRRDHEVHVGRAP